MQGLRHYVAVGAGAAVLAALAYQLAAHALVIPACAEHGRAHGISLLRFEPGSHVNDSDVMCVYAGLGGAEQTAPLREAATFTVDLAASFATDLAFTLPAFAAVCALLARVQPWRSRPPN